MSAIHGRTACSVARTSSRGLRDDSVVQHIHIENWLPPESPPKRLEIALDQLKHNGDTIERIQGYTPDREMDKNQDLASQTEMLPSFLLWASLYDVSSPSSVSIDSMDQYSRLQMREISAVPGRHDGRVCIQTRL